MHLQQFDLARKLMSHFEWLEAYQSGKCVTPICIEIDMTNLCNYRCPTCVWQAYRKQDISNAVPLEQIFGWIHDCADSGVKAIVFSGGGEPLMNSGTVEAIKTAFFHGINVGLLTNGVLITEKIVQIIKEACTWVRVHLDAISPQQYYQNHGVPFEHIERVRQNLMKLNQFSNRPDVGIGSIINRKTFIECQAILKFAIDTGCDFVQFKPDFDFAYEPAFIDWWNSKVYMTLKELESLYGKQIEIEYQTLSIPRATGKYCHIHHLTTAINAKGDYTYCKRLRNVDKWASGNLNKNKLRDIVRGDRNKELSRKIGPHNCGISCPYNKLNEYIANLCKVPIMAESYRGEHIKHINFF